jgi:probable F420-dependent oxidoreductase
MEFDLSLMGTALEDVATRTGALASMGADGFFAAEGPHDVFAPLYLSAAGAPGAALMTNAAIAFPRNPIHLAHSAWDLQRLSSGRFRLGIAPQVPAHITRRFGLEWSRPVERMADLVAALHAIFATFQDGAPLQHEGDFYRHTLMTPMFNPGPLAWGAPPVILGALGPAMTSLAVREADGLSILPFCSEALLRESTLPAIEAGLESAGRDRTTIDIICGAIVAVGSSDEELAAADAGARALLGFYGSTPAYRRVLASIGRVELADPLSAAVRAGDFGALGSLIDDHVVEELALVGRPAEVAERLVRRFGWLADRVALFLPAAASDETLTELFASLHQQSPRSAS